MFFCGNAKAQTTTDDSPKIRFEAKRIDYGDVLYKKDSTYVYRFVYENVGSAPLIVNQVIGHCPCVSVTHSIVSNQEVWVLRCGKEALGPSKAGSRNLNSA